MVNINQNDSKKKLSQTIFNNIHTIKYLIFITRLFYRPLLKNLTSIWAFRQWNSNSIRHLKLPLKPPKSSQSITKPSPSSKTRALKARTTRFPLLSRLKSRKIKIRRYFRFFKRVFLCQPLNRHPLIIPLRCLFKYLAYFFSSRP